ncbi:hypothetical protein [Pelagibius marinus]|uniref:hypothetical protein n=1 Tax=Pelagibius marinus TaxID=2762760 RepID=UPI001872D75F|nr:hypothetical protein [Pelagibius marinus]
MSESLRTTAGAPAQSARGRLAVAVCLLAVMALDLAARLSGSGLIQLGANAAVFACAIAAVRDYGLREIYLLSLCAVLALMAAWLHPEPVAVLLSGLDQASFLMAFLLLLNLLHEAASTSPSVARCGDYLTKQPPGRRYYALNAGSAVMAVLFNVGVVSFLVPLIQRGIQSATPGDALNPIRERRQLSAMLRGFAWCVIWSPTAIAPLALMELIPGTDRQLWILIGACIFLGLLVLGALEDQITFRAYKPQTRRQVPTLPRAAFLRFGLACAWLFGMSALVMWLSGETVVFGLMVSCPVMLVGWLLVQNLGAPHGALAATARRLDVIAFTNLAGAAPVAVTLACSGFVGRVAAALIPAQAWARFLGLDAMPDFVFLALLPAVIALLSLLALSPIMMAVFFGSLIGGLPVLPADPTLIALSISCGWALSMTFSPFATVVLLIDRVSGISSRDLTWGWNLVFTLLAAAALVPVFALLTGGR